MKRIQKIILILPIAMSFFFIAPKANYSDKAYQVPWSSTDNYVIIDNNGELYGYSSETNLQYANISGFHYLSSFNAKTIYGYKFNGVNWSSIGQSSHNNTISRQVITIPVNLPNFTGNRFSNHTVTIQGNGATVFPQALFQLQLTPSQIRERATQEALTQATASIWDSFGVILPIALAMLSVLLGLWLLRRLTVSAVR